MMKGVSNTRGCLMEKGSTRGSKKKARLIRLHKKKQKALKSKELLLNGRSNKQLHCVSSESCGDKNQKVVPLVEEEEFECPLEYEEWRILGVPLAVIRGLVDQGFTTPTEIQRRVIPAALKNDRDVVGAAETGSGKTLAFGIPILNYILSTHPPLSLPTQTKKRKRNNKEEIKTTDNGSRVVDINEVVFVSERYASNEGEESRSEDEDGAGNKRKKRKTEPMDDSIDSEEDDDGAVVGLVDSNDFIPNELFERSLKTGKRISELLEEEGSEPGADGDGGSDDEGMIGLILTPTRELAMQIKAHIDAVAKYTGIKTCAVVGGMSGEKQERLLNHSPQLVIATPGRLWKMMKEDENPHLNNFRRLKFLVLDEADRMVEHGHFNELSLILEKLSSDTETPPTGGYTKTKGMTPPGRNGRGSYRTMVFSATLTLPKQKTKGKKAWKVQTKEQNVENLIAKASLSEDAVVIDLSTKKGTVDRLTESKIMCTSDEKDVYLYYCLMACKGRKLVFTNSLDCLNRLRSLLEALRLKPLPLHARMQQRQRLKNLDRFTSSNDGLMVASDVAARGLDIPKVEHVVHYQTPKNSEVYVHRSGRTARGKAEGTSVMLVAPEDLQGYRNICRTLNREEELDNFPVDISMLKPLRERVSLARKLDTEEHKFKKSSRSQSWLEQTAKAMDIILDENFDEEKEEKCRERTHQQAVVKSLRSQLNQLLDQKIIPRDVSLSFPSQAMLEHHQKNFSDTVNKLKQKKFKKK